jgi:hypothetical protein
VIIDPRPALRALMLSDAAILAKAGQRIYPLKAKQGETRPLVVYQRTSSIAEHTLDGPTSLSVGRYQIDAWAKDIDDAVELANAVKFKLDGYSGTFAYGDDSPQAEVKFHGIFFDGREFEDFDEAAKMYRASKSYLVHYRERE